jgi:hypothetical protein
MGVTKADLTNAASDEVSPPRIGALSSLASGGVGGRLGEVGKTVDVDLSDLRSGCISFPS